jgi:hypothetical protein
LKTDGSAWPVIDMAAASPVPESTVVEDDARAAAVGDAEGHARALELRAHRPERLAVDVEPEVAVREADHPRALDDFQLLADEHHLMRVPLSLCLLLRPPQLPRVAVDQHVALPRVAEPAFAHADQVGEPEHGGLHLPPEPRLEVGALEVGADGKALILANVLAALPARQVREGERRQELQFLLPERALERKNDYLAAQRGKTPTVPSIVKK